MSKLSLGELLIAIIEKYHLRLRPVVRLFSYFLIFVFIGFFIKFGFDYASRTHTSAMLTLLYGILITTLALLLFFVAHFSGGIDFNLKMLGLPLGLAMGGSSCGLIVGYYRTFISMIVGIIVGSTIVMITVQIYRKKIGDT